MLKQTSNLNCNTNAIGYMSGMSALTGATGATGYTGPPGPTVVKSFDFMLLRELKRKEQIKKLEMLFTGCSVTYDPFAKRMVIHTGKRIPWKDLESLQASGPDFKKEALKVENMLTESLFELLNGAKMMRELTKNNEVPTIQTGYLAFKYGF